MVCCEKSFLLEFSDFDNSRLWWYKSFYNSRDDLFNVVDVFRCGIFFLHDRYFGFNNGFNRQEAGWLQQDNKPVQRVRDEGEVALRDSKQGLFVPAEQFLQDDVPEFGSSGFDSGFAFSPRQRLDFVLFLEFERRDKYF